MKKLSFSNVILTIVIAISLFLSYLLIFGNITIWSILRPGQETAQVNIQNDNETAVSNYYQTANQRLQEVLYPTNVIISQDNQAYLLNHETTLKSITTLLSQRRATLSGDVKIPDEDEYLKLMTQKRVELEFTTVLPFHLLDNFIKDETDEEDFTFNRIIIPTNSSGKIYLVNAMTHQYMEAKFPSGTTGSNFLKEAENAREQWVKAERYSLSTGNHVYLPTQKVTIPTQVYTLNIVPENSVVTSLFGNNRTWRSVVVSEDSDNNSITYRNANIEIQLNPLVQILAINYKNNSQNEAKNLTQQIEQSYAQVRQFEYWTQGLRYNSQSNHSTAVFQRYLLGYPVFSPNNTTPYASSRVSFRNNNLTSSITRLTMSMLFLEAHIQDQSRDMELLDASSLLYELNVAGFDVSDFSNVVIGYEWQHDMANFQKVNFVPKWFFEKNNVYYSLNQLKEGAIKVERESNVENRQAIAEQEEQNGF
ncbi:MULTISPECIES: two-component system activity regulator YycH [unclassified Facklamia]|uniref:two-component system activity regulator YycH n=1 Tax=Aerococcaceae TaxID=186827 RepID=UPI0013B756AB|nr:MULTISPECIES: two-component system activity regulator YycH [unclassified Facklamia]NEW64535.1 hypothetical protein [Facklamia sp. 252]NEW67742.1 hypothetical protein [Facklamia sp. 253]QQD65718.1 hypothetical protein JDW14_00895 [Aerococcaceae bacterium zg-252]